MSATTVKMVEHNLRMFIEIKNALDECDPEIQEVVTEMLDIYADENASEDEKSLAFNTIAEALFPSLSTDILRMERERSKTETAHETDARLNQEEAVFADNLRQVMAVKQITQEELAKRTGVGQSAISNMLNRQSRPQQRTVGRFAEALGVSPQDLWPR